MRRRLANKIMPVVVASAVVGLSPGATADHLSPNCYGGHDGPHVFPITNAQVTIEFVSGPFAGQFDVVTLNGPTYIESTLASNTQLDTEIVKMDLAGVSSAFGPVKVTENPLVASVGSVQPVGENCFPATSTFDVFVVIDLPTLGLVHNDDPAEMTATINEVPPESGVVYADPSTSIPLYLGPPHNGPPVGGPEDIVGYITHAQHVPRPTMSPSPPLLPSPNVPVGSAWGLATLAAILVTGGAVISRKRLR